MKKMIMICVGILGMLLLSGCGSTKLVVSSMKPAEVKDIKKGTKVAVTDFKNDYANRLSSMVQTKLASKEVKGEQYLEIVSRDNINSVLREQQLQSSDIVDPQTAVRFGKIIGAGFLVTGNVMESGSQRDYVRSYTRCVRYYRNSSQCYRYERYRDICNVVRADVQATINLVDVQTGKVRYSRPYTKSWNTDSCEYSVYDARMHVQNGQQALNYLLEEISTDFANRITPTLYYTKIEIMEDYDYPLTSKQKQQFEAALKYLKQNRIERAKGIFEDIHYGVGQKSYVVAYNYAILEESMGNFERAYTLYVLADKLTIEPNKLISQAIMRLDETIQDKEVVQEQMRSVD